MVAVRAARVERFAGVLVVLVGGMGACKKHDEKAAEKRTAAETPLLETRDVVSDSGYGQGVSSAMDLNLSIDDKRALLQLARRSVEGYVRTGRIPEPAPGSPPPPTRLTQPQACFVTLRIGGELRGCIGSLEPRRSLWEDVRQNAVSAAIHDTRFPVVREEELDRLDYEISVLDLPRPLQAVSRDELPAYLARHRPGVIIQYRGRRSTFLPSVWEDLSDPLDFLRRLCRKQGSHEDCWREPDVQISVYGSNHFTEKDVG